MKRKPTLNISKNNLFIISGIFFLLFTFIGNTINNILLSGILLLLVIIIFINIFLYSKKYLIILLFIIIGSSLGLFSSYTANQNILEKQKILENYLYYKYDFKAEITGVNKIEKYSGEYKVRLINLSTEGFNPLKNNELTNNNSIPLKGTFSLQEKESIKSNIEGLITIPSNFNVEVGDIISFSEVLRKIENFDSNFNYEGYSHSQNIFFKVNAGSINNIGKVDRNFIVDNIDKTRQILLEKIKQLYTEEEGIFLGGILLGARESMSERLKTDFNNSGLTHFIAVSGFNITILIIFLSYLLKIFPAFIRVIVITLSVGAFVILVGDTVSVIRASIMGLIGYYIMLSGRTAHNLAIVVFVGIIMVFISPLSINYDASLHLSFLAVLGILYTQKFFTKIFFFLPEFLAIREAFILTLSAMSFALPIILFNFGQVSIMSPIANIAITWTIPLAMLGGFLSILVDFVSHDLGIGLSYLTWILLAWDIKIVHFFGGLDWSIIKVDLGIYKYSLEILYFVILLFLVNLGRKD